MPSLRASHAPRYVHIAALLIKHRAATTPSEELAGVGGPSDRRPTVQRDAEKLAMELQAMGPTFIKLGQVLSTRSDFLPHEYTTALGRLRDRVDPMPSSTAEAIVEDELGINISAGFSHFAPRPVGSASLGQVHLAGLRDGRQVAVKVQRPGTHERVADDVAVLAGLVAWLEARSDAARRYGLKEMVEQFARSLAAELDYRKEAANLRLVGSQLGRYGRLVIPQPVDDYCTARVLTMEYVAGRSVGSLSRIATTEMDGRRIADELFRAYLDQVLVHGLFNADPHPGNLILTDDGRLAIVDFGQVARLDADTQERLLRLLVAISDGDSMQAARSLEALGERLEDYDSDRLRVAISEVVLELPGKPLSEIRLGRVLADLARRSVDSGLKLPAQLTLLAKAMLTLDEVTRRIDPSFIPGEAVQTHLSHLMRHRVLRSASPGRLVEEAMEAKEFAEQLPARLNKVLDSLAEGDFSLNLEGLDEPELIRGVQKLANRGATGVLIAALLLSAAIFAVPKSRSTVLGYPIPTIVLLGLALVATVWMVIGIVRSDLPQRRRRSP